MTSGVVNRGRELLKRPVVMTSGVVNPGKLGPWGGWGGLLPTWDFVISYGITKGPYFYHTP
jgi:hypothetical protein